jgi:uncharacterized cupredoxin-like copper-binding protein
MRCHRTANRLVFGGTALFLLGAACDSSQQATHIVAQDFRFTPAEVRLRAGQPIRLVIRNEGRERHQFKSPLLPPTARGENGLPGSLPVLPNQKAEAVLRTMPGLYPFHCAIPGHAGMNGTIIVE